MLAPLALLAFGCIPPCDDGYGRDKEGHCVPIAAGDTDGTTGPAPVDSAPPEDSGDSGESPALNPDRWFDPLTGTPNILFLTLDTQRADAMWAEIDALPDWFKDYGVDYTHIYTPSSHTGESAAWMMSGCDVRDGPSQLTDGDGAPLVTLPEGCLTVADVYNEAGYNTRLCSENYGFVNGSWYAADEVQSLAVPRIDWSSSLIEQLESLPEPWGMTWWLMGARLPFLKLSDDPDCEGAPLGYDLSKGSDLDRLEEDVASMASADLNTIREMMDCNYAADTREVMERVAEMLEQLAVEGLLDNTVVVMTNDHGELVLDYTDPIYPEGYADPKYWLEHGNQLFLHETAGFAKVWYPGADEVRVVERYSGSPDLLALLYNLTGVSNEKIRGVLPWDEPTPVLQALQDGEYLFGVTYEDGGAPYRYLVRPWDGSEEQLYALSEDPEETTNLIAQGEQPPQEILDLIDSIEEDSAGDPPDGDLSSPARGSAQMISK